MPPSKRLSEPGAIDQLGLGLPKLSKAQPKALTDAQRAKLLKVSPSALQAPLELSPAKPMAGKAHLRLFSCVALEPPSLQAVFASTFQAVATPVRVWAWFPAMKKNRSHLVEFHLTLHQKEAYTFRTTTLPFDESQEVTRQGGAAHVLPVLTPPSGEVMIGVSLALLNPPEPWVGWTLHTVRVSTTQ